MTTQAIRASSASIKLQKLFFTQSNKIL